MQDNHLIRTFSCGAAALFFTACAGVQFTHVAPGQSARKTLAERNAPPAPEQPGGFPSSATPRAPESGQPILPLPSVPLPQANDTANKVADAFTRGTFAMQAGQNAEAIAAFEEAVKLDPNFSDAWTKLTLLYLQSGDTTKATEAYKKAKKLGQPNGSETGTPSGSLL